MTDHEDRHSVFEGSLLDRVLVHDAVDTIELFLREDSPETTRV